MKYKFKVVFRKKFRKELKKLSKKYRTLDDDLRILINTPIHLYHHKGMDTRSVFRIPGLGIDYPKIYKVKKFACKSLKGKGSRTGLRLIYAYYEDRDKIELIEIYEKSKKNNENRRRIKQIYS